MAGGISLTTDQTLTPAAKPFALFQPTSPFSPPDLRQPPATLAGGIVNGAMQAQNVQNSLQDLVSFVPPTSPLQGPSSPLSSTSQGVGVTTLSNPTTPPPLAPPTPPVTIGNINTPPQNPNLPPPADLAVQAAQQVPNITGTYAANIAGFAQTASAAQVAATTLNAAALAAAPAPQTTPAPQPAPQQSTNPLSTQGLAYTQTLHAQQVQSENTSDANQAREAQIRADAQRAELQAQLDAARAAEAQRQVALASQQSSAIQIAAAAASATVDDVAAKASVPGSPAILTVSDAGGNVLFRRPATDAEVSAARAAADEALREAQAALARLALDQSVAGQPLGLDPPKGDIRTVDPRVTAEFNATDRNVPNPVPQIPAFVGSGQIPDFVSQGDLPAFDSPILPPGAPAPATHNPHQAA